VPGWRRIGRFPIVAGTPLDRNIQSLHASPKAETSSASEEIDVIQPLRSAGLNLLMILPCPTARARFTILPIRYLEPIGLRADRIVVSALALCRFHCNALSFLDL
jgi:hypothetical protein